MSWCPRGGKLGLSMVYRRPSGIGNQGFSLCPRMTLRLPSARIEVIS